MLFSPTQQHPMREHVTVLTLVDGLYEEQVFQADDRILCQSFPQLNLTVRQILQVGEGSNAG
ncbi:MAG: hypothetical protein NW224_18775 [Leptolyngbyaceae cyanobacterium bins.302]|nr:hypothetical protein [Leptolyngbyaceae cyanobacterium bins.302]